MHLNRIVYGQGPAGDRWDRADHNLINTARVFLDPAVFGCAVQPQQSAPRIVGKRKAQETTKQKTVRSEKKLNTTGHEPSIAQSIITPYHTAVHANHIICFVFVCTLLPVCDGYE